MPAARFVAKEGTTLESSRPYQWSLSQEEWERWRADVERWLEEQASLDVTDTSTLSTEAQRFFNERFERHPAYAGQRVLDVFDALLKEARRAQAMVKVLSAKPQPTQADHLTIIGLETTWSRFGGATSSDADPGELAKARLQFELTRDAMLETKNEFGFTDYQRSRERYARYGPEKNWEVLLRQARPYLLVLGLVASGLGLITGGELVQMVGVVALFVALAAYFGRAMR